MGGYVLRRLGSGALTLFLFLSSMFFLVNVVIPGDYVSRFIMTASQAEALRDQLGLDRPLHIQYLDWLGSVVTLDLGESFGGAEVWPLVRDAAASTAVVLLIGLGLAFTIGAWLGRVSAYRVSGPLSGSLTIAAILFLTLFPPALAFAMERGVQSLVGWFGLGEFATLSDDLWAAGPLGTTDVLWRMAVVFALSAGALWLGEWVVWRVTRRRLPRAVFLLAMVALPLVVWQQLGLAGRVLDLTATMSLLIVGVTLLTFGEVLLVTRAAMDDVMLEDYVMVARAKGLPEREVRDRHAARPAFLPVLSRFTVSIPYFLTGLVILEVVFSGSGSLFGGAPLLMRVEAPPGLGTLIFTALAEQDTRLVAGALLLVGALTLFLRIALDVAHAALDPRIRFGGRRDA